MVDNVPAMIAVDWRDRYRADPNVAFDDLLTDFIEVVEHDANTANKARVLRNFLVQKAAPLMWTFTGTDESAMYLMTEYLERLETIADEARGIVGDHCPSHEVREEHPDCETCSMITRLLEVGR